VVFYFVQLLSEETIFQICDPSATLIFNSMFVVGVLYCVQLFIDVFSFVQNPSLLSFSFPLLKLFSFYFLSSIFKISKCLISLNIGCLIKTPLKTALKQFFKGVPHQQPWSSIVCLLWGFSIVSSFLLTCFLLSKIRLFFRFSFLC